MDIAFETVVCDDARLFPPWEQDHNRGFQYLSRLETTNGNSIIFGVDEQGRSFLTGKDFCWAIEYLGGGKYPLNEHFFNNMENDWLLSCWDTSHFCRVDADAEVPIDALSFRKASDIWDVPETDLRQAASADADRTLRLAADNLGGVWLTSYSAMIKHYGLPRDELLRLTVLNIQHRLC